MRSGISRRRLLWGVATLAVAGGTGWYAAGRGVFDDRRGAPFAPWTALRGRGGGGPMELVRAAVLAASPHNTQPWLFEVNEDRIDVFSDPSRSLGNMDPFGREMHIGLGCAIENLALAAGALGWTPRVELGAGRLPLLDIVETGEARGPAPRPTRVATVQLDPGGAESPLAQAIAERHTNRGPYRAQRVPASALRDLSSLNEDRSTLAIVWLEHPEQRERFAAHTVRATEIIAHDAAMVEDSDAWFRLTPEAIRSHRDGVTLDAMGLGSVLTAASKLLPRPSPERMHEDWIRVTREVHLADDPMTGVIAVRDRHDLGATLGAGRLWQRMQLWAAARGIAMHPLSQVPEVIDRERQLGRAPAVERSFDEALRLGGWQPTMAFRLGYAVREGVAGPRRAAEDVLHVERAAGPPFGARR
ncbi:Acg family FMN-binding oxidoreductase [Sorangium sp. So ce1335]|uniref:Acg family FMN-binding oxidoreductase n=1 Tax=Sorangium sp. So ce1335 TaxID=3133335 RepID=UPI003F6387AC